jgi:cytochrome c
MRRLASLALYLAAALIVGARWRSVPPGEAARSITRGKALGRYVAAALCIALAGATAAAVGWRMTARMQEERIARALTGGEPQRAPALMIRFGCAGCHSISGISGADGQVGPALAGLRQRVFVGGVVRNTADNLAAWIVDPPALSPKTAMPVTGISLPEARDVAAYLYSH